MGKLEKRGVRVIDCRRAVQQTMQISEADLLGDSIERRCSLPRQMAMALAREFTDASLTTIGRHFGRDHATVLHAIRRVAGAECTAPDLKAAMARVRSILRISQQNSTDAQRAEARISNRRLGDVSSKASNPRHNAMHGADGHRDKKNAHGRDAASPRPGAFRHPLSALCPDGQL